MSPLEVNADAAYARVDLLNLASLVEPGSRVLDVGCGDGSLLRLLAEKRSVDGRGIELSQSGVNLCVAKGLSVIQGDAGISQQMHQLTAADYLCQITAQRMPPCRTLTQ